jgi:transposase-like protein
MNKTAVMGLLERHDGTKCSTVRMKVIENRQAETLHAVIHKNVESGSQVFTDEHRGYAGLDADFVHAVINHAEKYVDGHVHTNGLENFWALFKRCIKGTHVSVEPFHLFRYLDSESFRFNNRKTDDGNRFLKAVGQVEGKRLTYKALIGQNLEASSGNDSIEESGGNDFPSNSN